MKQRKLVVKWDLVDAQVVRQVGEDFEVLRSVAEEWFYHRLRQTRLVAELKHGQKFETC